MVIKIIKIISPHRNLKDCVNKVLKPPTTSNISLAPLLNYIKYNMQVKFDEVVFFLNKIIYTHISAVYEINVWTYSPTTKFMRGKSLFGAVELTKNAYSNKYRYSGYGIGFDTRRSSCLMVAGLVEM